MTTPTGRRSRLFLRAPLPEARARVFLLPYSGCGASMYRQWPALHEGVNFCPVQLPGRENRMREAPFDSYEELADSLAEELLPHLDRPYALFGHCSSALAAYETALRLVERGCPPPARLVVSSEVAPQDGPYGRFLQMTDEELAAELRALMIGLGGEPHPDLIDLTLRVLRHDVEVNKRYHVAEPTRLPCPVTSLGWSRDTGIEPRLMSGWSACGDVDDVVLDGDHYAFVDAPADLVRLFTDTFTTA
ncbi:thioesterase [Streptomyces spiroverticillatus]|uniref:Thioesterase n=1 Tax=Streptomyces finlayi TaxID=67296 RepID=A0A918WY33_9ACTN|nr:thioesterase [Streptomyces finlayi]GHA11505.1 thioesterase [Streptomyces spiroverticillatus]GHC94969.1 thioesterase [Streptomyces finlayi]